MTVAYRARGCMVLLRMERIESINSLAMPQQSAESKRFFVVSFGPDVEDLAVGDEVIPGGKAGTEIMPVPNEKNLWIAFDENCLLKVDRGK